MMSIPHQTQISARRFTVKEAWKNTTPELLRRHMSVPMDSSADVHHQNSRNTTRPPQPPLKRRWSRRLSRFLTRAVFPATNDNTMLSSTTKIMAMTNNSSSFMASSYGARNMDQGTADHPTGQQDVREF